MIVSPPLDLSSNFLGNFYPILQTCVPPGRTEAEFLVKLSHWLGSGRELPDAEGNLLCVAPPPPGAVQGGHHVDHEDQHHLQVHRVQI